MKKLKLIFGFILMAGMTLTMVTGCSGEEKTAMYYVDGLKEAGLPIGAVEEYTEESDPNNLLGRPNQYTSKVNFEDTRIEQYDDEPIGGMIEVFENKKDMETRKRYMENISDVAGAITQWYMYSNDKALMRIELDLTPEQAEEYRRAFENL